MKYLSEEDEQWVAEDLSNCLPSEPPVRFSRLVSCVGSQPPKGYIQWHAWAKLQYDAGLRQAQCSHCGLWKFPQEMSALEETSKGTTRRHGGTVIITKHKVCNECAANRRAMSDDQNNPNAMHELKTPEPTESVVRSMPLLEDAERLATQLEQKVFEIDRRRQSIREELERLDALHSWMNARRHEAASIVARMKAASSNEGS